MYVCMYVCIKRHKKNEPTSNALNIKHKHKHKETTNHKPTYLCCAVFTSNTLDISRRKMELHSLCLCLCDPGSHILV